MYCVFMIINTSYLRAILHYIFIYNVQILNVLCTFINADNLIQITYKCYFRNSKISRIAIQGQRKSASDSPEADYPTMALPSFTD